jgi:hypothetical protein
MSVSLRLRWFGLAAVLVGACGPAHYEGGGRRRELPQAGGATSPAAGTTSAGSSIDLPESTSGDGGAPTSGTDTGLGGTAGSGG